MVAGLAVLALLAAVPAQAYIGPGAGVALLSSFLVVLTTMVVVVFSILILPFRLLIRALMRKEKLKPWVSRVIIVGLDGQDPKLTERFMKEGKLPNFAKLAKMGSFQSLKTTFPSLSPTAWSSFATGTHPAKHNIYDFLTRDPRSYLPLLSSTHIGDVERFLKIGKYRIPLKKPELRLLRKSKPTWTILGEHGIWSTVLRVPITFPPEEFHGAQLSAMCTPDLLGSQGTFLLYTTRPAEAKFKEGGIRVALAASSSNPDRFETRVTGPENIFLDGRPPLQTPLTIVLDRAGQKATVTVEGVADAVGLTLNQLSDWISLTFRAAPGIKVKANCRMMVTEMGEHFSLYVTPLNIDPENPAMPISHPSYYATYLAKRIGPFCTLGLAEDTWALNEGVIDDGAFLKQAYDIDREREQMFFTALDKLRTGTLTCVFDATDRIQHMFWRYFEKGHPAARGKERGAHADAIEAIYRHNDELVGKVLERLKKDDLLMVVSDHGFASFRRGVNLNAWLREKGWLVLKEGGDGSTEWLRDVDWSRTKAYAIGLTGVFLNLEGREAQGILKAGGEAAAFKAEILAALKGLRDGDKGPVAINEAFDTAELYSGPYLQNAPDLIIGFNDGYRTSWDGATGVVSGAVFEDNVKAWSGDHCIDPRLVPGILFASRKVDRKDPSLVDIAPTVLRLFDVEAPAHMDGKPLYEKAFARG